VHDRLPIRIEPQARQPREQLLDGDLGDLAGDVVADAEWAPKPKAKLFVRGRRRSKVSGSSKWVSSRFAEPITSAISVPAGISFPPMTTSAAVSFSVMLKGGIQRSPSCTVAADRPRGSAATAAACSGRPRRPSIAFAAPCAGSWKPPTIIVPTVPAISSAARPSPSGRPWWTM
jgi:hypothetical protein